MRAQAQHSAALQRSFFELLDAADAKDALAAGKIMARAWVQMRDPNVRVSAACTFIAKVVSSYAAAVADSADGDVVFGVPPGHLVDYPLDGSAINLANTMGGTAASLEPDEAAHAISMVYTTMLPGELRARYGIYYTPPASTRRLIAMATEAGVDWSKCRVLDPACGAFAQPGDRRGHRFRLGRVHPRHRLVEQQQVGLGAHARRELDALAVAVGSARDGPLEGPVSSEQFGDSRARRACCSRRSRGAGQRQAGGRRSPRGQPVAPERQVLRDGRGADSARFWNVRPTPSAAIGADARSSSRRRSGRCRRQRGRRR